MSINRDYIRIGKNRVTTTRNRGTGSTAIIISNKITHHVVNIQTTSLDNTTIHIMINNQEIRISIIVQEPSKTFSSSRHRKPFSIQHTYYNCRWPTCQTGLAQSEIQHCRKSSIHPHEHKLLHRQYNRLQPPPYQHTTQII